MRKFIFAVLLILFGCSTSEKYHISIENSGTKVVTGKFERSLLETDPDLHPWFDFRYAGYSVDTAFIPAITSLAKGTEYIIILGTWCGDSKEEVPHLLKIFDAASIEAQQIQLFGVDRSKKSEDGAIEKYAVERVPTFIVLKNGVEIGRIVEHPLESLEKDLAGILKKQ